MMENNKDISLFCVSNHMIVKDVLDVIVNHIGDDAKKYEHPADAGVYGLVVSSDDCTIPIICSICSSTEIATSIYFDGDHSALAEKVKADILEKGIKCIYADDVEDDWPSLVDMEIDPDKEEVRIYE